MLGFLAALGAAAAACYVLLYLYLRHIQTTSYTAFKVLGDASALPADAPAPKTLNLIQMNVFWRPWLLHILKEEYVQERSQLLVERLAEFDIVCLNEAFHFGSNTVREFVERMRGVGFEYVVCADPPTFKYIIDNGAMILSKYPIVETASAIYKEGCSWDQFGAKGPLFARVQISKDKHVNVFATHLQASYRVVTHVDFGVRSSQAMFLRDFIKQHTAGDNSPIFLLGDMNINAIGEEHEYKNLMNNLEIGGDWELIDTLKEKGHPVTIAESLTADGTPYEEVLTQKSDWGWAKAIDYVFIYKNRKSQGVAAFDAEIEKMAITGKPYKQLSDHFAVRCKVDLE